MWFVSASAAELPLERLSTGHLVVEVELADGHPRRFLLDTGAGVVTLSPPLAEALGIPADSGRSVEAETANGSVTVRVVPLDGVAIGGVDLTGVRAAVLDLGPIVAGLEPEAGAEFAAIDGVLGRGFFERADVRLDLAAERVGLWDPGAAPQLAAQCVPFHLRHGIVEVKGRVGGVKTRTLLDLGANGGIASSELAAWGRDTGSAASAMGAEGQSVTLRVVQFDEVALGEVALGPLELNVCPPGESGVACPDGKRAILGVDAVEGRSLTLSYARRELCVGPAPA
ncbi:MAG: aspartyl protease family protein [Myxococcota bacterium]